jgi:hypothetical protein
MAMKKTSDGDSPLRQGTGKSFWTLPISGRRRRWIAMYSGKVIGYLGFSRWGVFIGEGAAPEVDQGQWRSQLPATPGSCPGSTEDAPLKFVLNLNVLSMD